MMARRRPAPGGSLGAIASWAKLGSIETQRRGLELLRQSQPPAFLYTQVGSADVGLLKNAQNARTVLVATYDW